jgi:hypothetical protein
MRILPAAAAAILGAAFVSMGVAAPAQAGSGPCDQPVGSPITPDCMACVEAVAAMPNGDAKNTAAAKCMGESP